MSWCMNIFCTKKAALLYRLLRSLFRWYSHKAESVGKELLLVEMQKPSTNGLLWLMKFEKAENNKEMTFIYFT